MTEFVYENENKLNQLSLQILEEGRCEKAYDDQWLDVYKYLLAYTIVKKREIGYGIVEKIRRQILEYNTKKETLVFLEKMECKPMDFLFFENYMRKAERNKEFRDTWYTHFKRIA